jgi:hypothetical protein
MGHELPADGDITEWMKQVRTSDNPELGKPPPAAPRKPSLLRPLAIGLALVFAALAVYIGATADPIGSSATSAQTVQGAVYDVRKQPLARALVFVEAHPELAANTAADGTFVLKRVPAGEQKLVVVFDDVGQEYPVTIQRDSPNEVGTLVYRAPPGQ